VQLAREAETITLAQGHEARASLLPNVSGAVHEQRQVANVAALGVQPQIAGLPVTLPSNPYSTFDARIMAEQTFFDWNAIRRNQAAHAAERSSHDALAAAQQGTVSRVALSYFAAVRADALTQAAASDLALADALVNQAKNRESAGNGLAIDVTRSRVQLAHARQRLLDAQDQSFRARLQLCRELGIPPGPGIILTDELSVNRELQSQVEEALNFAMQNRSDLKAQIERGRQAGLLHEAARAANLPSVSGYADYGPLGLSPGNAIETYSVGVAIKIPIFDGGERQALEAKAASVRRQERIRERDLRSAIEVEVQESLNSLKITAAQVEAAEEGASLASDELAQAQRRFNAGLMTNAELVQAQDRLERARDERVAAIYAYDVALVDAARASGNVMLVIP
jgi:outer membrane protein